VLEDWKRGDELREEGSRGTRILFCGGVGKRIRQGGLETGPQHTQTECIGVTVVVGHWSDRGECLVRGIQDTSIEMVFPLMEEALRLRFHDRRSSRRKPSMQLFP